MSVRASLLALCTFALAACASGGQRTEGGTYADAMAREHAGHTPAANAASEEPRQEVVAEDVVYGLVDGERVTGYYARPAAGNAAELPALLVIHEWWGLNDNVKMMARRLAGEGYQVLAVDMYHGKVAATPQEARAYMQEVLGDTDRGVAHMMSAALFMTQEKRAGRIGVTGWCFGGGWALASALFMPENVDAAVMYYGRIVTDRAELAKLDAPLLGLFGAEDTGIPVDSVRRMETTLNELGKDVEIVVYPGARHAFANPSGEAYDAQAAGDAWRRTIAFFNEHLKGQAGTGM